MTIQLTFSEKAQYLLVEACGNEWNTQDGVDAILSISDRAKEYGHKRILIDRRDLSSPTTDFARFEAGVTIAKVLSPPIKLAVVYPHGQMEKFGEDAAVNRGAIAAAFSKIEAARQWLLE